VQQVVGARLKRIGIGVAAIAAAALLVITAAPASAETCTTSAPTGSLAFTGADVAGLLGVGLALVVVGAALVASPRALASAGLSRVRTLRPRRYALALCAVGALVTAVVLLPGRAVASTTTGSGCTTTDEVTGPSTGSPGDPAALPPAVVPEAPVMLLIPVTGAAVAALVVVCRRRRDGRAQPGTPQS
jgi:hypothetical protein